MISEILKLIKERKFVSLNDLSIHFDITSSALKPILETLISKGYIKYTSVDCDTCNNDCNKCPYLKDKEFYQYNEKSDSL